MEATNVRPGRNRLHVLLTRARGREALLAFARARRPAAGLARSRGGAD